MPENFLRKIEELFKTEQSFSKNITYLLKHYKAYQPYLEPTGFERLEHVMEKYFRLLPKNIFDGLSFSANMSNQEISILIGNITERFTHLLGANLQYLSSSAIPNELIPLTKLVDKAQRLQPTLPVLVNGLAAPFQTITRYTLLLKDMNNLATSTDDPSVKLALAICFQVISALTQTINDLIREVETVLNMLGDNKVDHGELAEGIMKQKLLKQAYDLIYELSQHLNENMDKQVLQAWLQTNLLLPISKMVNPQDSIKFLEYFLQNIEENFSISQMQALNQAISSLTAHHSMLPVSSSLIETVERLGLTYSKNNKSNVNFLKFMAQLLEILTNANKAAETRAAFPLLEELIQLVELQSELDDKEFMRDEKNAEKKRLQMQSNSILNHPDVKVYRGIVHKFPETITADDIQEETYKKTRVLTDEIIELEREIAALNSKIAPLQTKKDNLARRYEAIDYKNKYPLHQAIRDADIEKIVELLMHDRANAYNKPDDANMIPIHQAYLKHHAEIFQLLYESTGVTIQEKEHYKKLIKQDYKMIKKREEIAKKKGVVLTENIEGYRAMAMLFKDPYHNLWNQLDPKLENHPAKDAQRVINVFEDYYAPKILAFMHYDEAQRFFTANHGRREVNLQKADAIVKSFRKFLIPPGSNKRPKKKKWNIETGIIFLNSLVSDVGSYLPGGSFEERLKYVSTQLNLIKYKTSPQASQNTNLSQNREETAANSSVYTQNAFKYGQAFFNAASETPNASSSNNRQEATELPHDQNQHSCIIL